MLPGFEACLRWPLGTREISSVFEGHRGLRLGDLTRTSIAALEDGTPTISGDSV